MKNINYRYLNPPKSGSTFEVYYKGTNFNRCFYQDGFWWYYNINEDGTPYYVGPIPYLWKEV